MIRNFRCVIVILLRVTVRLVCRTDMSHSTTPEPLVSACGTFKHTSMVIMTDRDIIYVFL